MITLMIAAAMVVFLIWFWIDNSIQANCFGDIFPYIGLTLIGSAVVTLLTVLVILIGSNFGVEANRTNEQFPIYSIRNSDTVSGRFFLGSGQITSGEYYYMFKKDERGGFERVTIKSTDAILFQNAKSPHVEYQKITYRQNRWISFIPFEWQVDGKYDIYIPANTIIEKYEVK